MGPNLIRASLLSASWAVGLLVAVWTIPGVSISLSGFTIGVAVFALVQATLSLPLAKLPRQYGSLLLGAGGLASTIIALAIDSMLTHGLSIGGMASWLATTVVVWLMTTIVAITLPE